MIKRDYSPFTPGTPVSVELFTGRDEQIRELDRLARNSAAGRLSVCFLTGERGLGKSSLAKYVRELAEKNHEMLGLHVFLGGVSELEEMVKKVFDRLVKDSIDRPWYEKIKQFLGNHIQEVGLFGVTVDFTADKKDLTKAVDDFAPALHRLIKELKGQKKGLLLILDDINGLASSKAFANWLKSLVDEIAVGREQLPLCIMLVGLEERRRELIRSQESLARVFNLIELPVWTKEETAAFYEKAFSSIKIGLKPDAITHLVKFSQGLPMVCHEIGDAILKVDEDNCIDYDDALEGVVNAAEVIGKKYFEPKVLAEIQSKKYRSILNKLVELKKENFSRAALAEKLNKEERQNLGNFLTRMKKLGVIRSVPEQGKGYYQFCSFMHYLYLIGFAELMPSIK